MSRRTSLLLLVGSGAVVANDNGLALTPPMGWRSWNLFGENVNQSLMQSIMDGLTVKRNGTSLSDLGYSDAGLDDNWQACGSPSAAPGMHYHDADGNPLVNTERFPDLKAMTDHARSLNLTAGWYGTCAFWQSVARTPALPSPALRPIQAVLLFLVDRRNVGAAAQCRNNR